MENDGEIGDRVQTQSIPGKSVNRATFVPTDIFHKAPSTF